jgi:hypothetical protein
MSFPSFNPSQYGFDSGVIGCGSGRSGSMGLLSAMPRMVGRVRAAVEPPCRAKSAAHGLHFQPFTRRSRVEEKQMKQVQRVVTLALALLLIGVPAVTMAQTSTSPSAPAADKAGKAEKPSTPSASPSTGATSGTSAGQASPALPMSAEDCKNNGWQKFGVKSEAECTAKVKK